MTSDLWNQSSTNTFYKESTIKIIFDVNPRIKKPQTGIEPGTFRKNVPASGRLKNVPVSGRFELKISWL